MKKEIFRKKHRATIVLCMLLGIVTVLMPIEMQPGSPGNLGFADAHAQSVLSTITNCVTALGAAGIGAVNCFNSLTGNNQNGGGIGCSGLVGYFNTPLTCISWTLSGVAGGLLAYVSSWFLAVAGILFNWVFYETILQFGQLINCGTAVAPNCNSGIITGINTAWSVFRDISNIIIIGMFTFIAIATILGNTEYGYKKMLARVLIVAVLINFSLLFTKIIIDASNFTAVQIYTAVSQNNPNFAVSNADPTSTSLSQLTTTGGQQSGVAGAFMSYGGLASFGDTSQAVAAIALNPQNGMRLLLYGIVVALLYLVAAIVLFYGTFLLISRALLMIFLMITASVAFATYLVPSLSQGGYGWSAWWKRPFEERGVRAASRGASVGHSNDRASIPSLDRKLG